MQGKHLYEYAVIRFVPRVEREEFINVGLIMFSKRARFIKARYQVDEKEALPVLFRIGYGFAVCRSESIRPHLLRHCRRWPDSLYGYSRAFPLADGSA